MILEKKMIAYKRVIELLNVYSANEKVSEAILEELKKENPPDKQEIKYWELVRNHEQKNFMYYYELADYFINRKDKMPKISAEIIKYMKQMKKLRKGTVGAGG